MLDWFRLLALQRLVTKSFRLFTAMAPAAQEETLHGLASPRTGAIENPELKNTLVRDWIRPVVFSAPLFLVLGGFYAWASSHGVNKEIGNPGIRNLAFILYEFLGFAGLGTPRLELRENPFVETLAPYTLLLVLGALPMIALCFFLLRTRPPKLVLPLLVSFCFGMAIALGVSKIEHFRVLGRHVAVFVPLLLVTILYWVGRQVSRKNRMAAIVALAGVVLVWAVSDARLVFMPKYGRMTFGKQQGLLRLLLEKMYEFCGSRTRTRLNIMV